MARLVAPYFLEKMANEKLSGIEGYNGVVEDIDLRLYKGEYIIDSAYFNKTNASFSEPFMAAEEVIISLDWNTLFEYGKAFVDIEINNPEINFIVAWADKEKGTKVKQFGKGVKWLELFRKLSPFKFNDLHIDNGTATFVDYTHTPTINFYMDNISIKTTNLQKIRDKDEDLPTPVEVYGTLIGGGDFSLIANMELKNGNVPDVRSNIKIENEKLTLWNDVLRTYTNLDVESGEFNLYSEISIIERQMDGYVKPIIDSIVIKGNEENEPFLDKAWETISAAIVNIFENTEEKQVATRTTISSSLENIDAHPWKAVWNIVKNAFIRAYDKEFARIDKEGK